MGIRTAYFIPTNEKSLLENFITAYPDFRNWTLNDWYDDEVSDYGGLFMGQRLCKEAIEYLEKNKNIDKTIVSNILDELLAVFIGSYCDHGEGRELYGLKGPMMKVWRYEKSTHLINKSCDFQTIQLWNRLNYGVSAKNDAKVSQAISKDIIIGWWTLEEIAILKIGLSKCFKNIETFNQWNEMRSIGNYSGKQEFEGLEYVFDIFDIAIMENKEIVFYTENE